MREVVGTFVTDACFTKITSLKKQGKTVYFRPPDDEGADCFNCFDAKNIHVTTITNRREVFFIFPCPICNVEGERDIISNLLSISNLQPEEFNWKLDFASGMPGKDAAISAVRNLLKGETIPVGWLSLFGSFGVGKSGLGKAAVATVCNAGQNARYVRAEDILSEARATFGRNGQALDKNDFMTKKRYARYQLLVIDEIDRIPKTDWAMSSMFSLLDERYNARHRRATIIISNTLPDSFPIAFGYLEDRLKDGNRVIMAGESLRGRIAHTSADTGE